MTDQKRNDADRELLELAAKAAGIVIDPIYSDKYPPTSLPNGYVVIINGSGGHSFWSPLADDGDALRLAVKLRINIMFNGGFHYVGTNSYVYDICQLGGMSEIRREIMVAAAEIGRNMLSSK